jgi:hypothetical protein
MTCLSASTVDACCVDPRYLDRIKIKARFLSEPSLVLQTSRCFTALSEASAVFPSRLSEASSVYGTSGTVRTREIPSLHYAAGGEPGTGCGFAHRLRVSETPILGVFLTPLTL